MKEIKKISELLRGKNQSKKILAVFAHPDDETINACGFLAKAREEGIRTYLICFTKGEKGSMGDQNKNNLGQKRYKELLRAGHLLGIEEIFCYGLPDGQLFNHQEKMIIFLKKILLKVKPGLILTHDISGGTGHPDHITVSLTVKSLLKKAGKDQVYLYFVVYDSIFKKIFQKNKERRAIIKSMPKPTHWLNTSSFIDLKKKIYFLYKSQKLLQSFPLAAKIWFSIFDKEYFHLVELEKIYKFKFRKFETNHFLFVPSGKKKFLA